MNLVRSRSVAVLAVSVPLALSFATSAAAGAPQPTAARLSGYQQQVSQVFDLPPGTQSRVTAECPAGTRLMGGGVALSGASLRDVNVNSSIPAPDGQTWSASVNNSGSSDGSAQAWATCAQAVANYTVVVGTGVTNPAGMQTTAEAACPGNTVPLGGGAFSDSSSTSIKLNSSYPLSRGWRVRMNNAGDTADTVTVYVACGTRPAGYVQQISGATTIAPHTRATARTLCPTGSVVLGGGGRSDSRSTVVDLNTSVPATDFGWLAYESNDTDATTQLRTYSTCAKSDDA